MTKLHKAQGISLFIALALLFIPLPFINGSYITTIIIFVNGLMEVFSQMALKDWKGGSKLYPYAWSNKKTKRMVSYDTWTPYKPDGHYVTVSGTEWPLTKFIVKKFKTKPQALKYAKAYMRKN